ncbi:MAG: proton-conducting transporter membrane subunit [Clostridia bacterium]|nr:proton-conducting transporter membrane subunit [Clostridia bacterium]MDD4571905.1 proton-conducting transporter membrane subunit [Clostridia bacterium]
MPAILIIVPLLGILILNILNNKTGEKIARPIGLIVALAQIVAVLASWISLWHNHAVSMDVEILGATFQLDIITMVVTLAIGMVVLMTLLTEKATREHPSISFTSLLFVLMLGMNGIAMVRDLFSLYVFLEITGISTFILIAYDKDVSALSGSFKYLLMSALASAFILSGIAMLFMQFGSVDFISVAAAMGDGSQLSVLTLTAVLLITAGIAIKAGMVPFHGWVADAYSSAPAAISVLVGGIVTKMAGMYAVMRLCMEVFSMVKPMTMSILVLGTISIVVGALVAMSQTDLKRVLAYSSISQLGYIAVGVATASPIGLAGALLHFFNHSTFKSNLFVNAAALEKQVGTRDIREMGGLQEKMPVTAVTSILSLLSAAGIPPLGGFWSKVLIIIALWQADLKIFAVIAVLASILTIGYFLYLQRSIFFGKLKEGLEHVTEAKGLLAVAAIVLSAVSVAIGVLFPILLIVYNAQGLL